MGHVPNRKRRPAPCEHLRRMWTIDEPVICIDCGASLQRDGVWRKPRRPIKLPLRLDC